MELLSNFIVLDKNKIQELMFLSEQAWCTLSRDINNHSISAGVTKIPMQKFLYITLKLALV
jgi:hypothetical protein